MWKYSQGNKANYEFVCSHSDSTLLFIIQSINQCWKLVGDFNNELKGQGLKLHLSKGFAAYFHRHTVAPSFLTPICLTVSRGDRFGAGAFSSSPLIPLLAPLCLASVMATPPAYTIALITTSYLVRASVHISSNFSHIRYNLMAFALCCDLTNLDFSTFKVSPFWLLLPIVSHFLGCSRKKLLSQNQPIGMW